MPPSINFGSCEYLHVVEAVMWDAAFLALGVVWFGLCFGYAIACERM